MGLQQLGPLRAQVSSGEGGKFTSPLLLVHGLWSGAFVWQSFTGYLAHRGWNCFAVELRRGEAEADVEQIAADLRGAIGALGAPPVIVGHDLGALLALRCSDVARALVLVAPLVLPPLAAAPPAALHVGGPIARLFAGARRAPRGRWKGAYASSGAVREPAALLRRLIERPLPVERPPQGVASLVVAGEHDCITPPASARSLAAWLGAEIEIIAGGHGLPFAPGWEALVARLHRWLIKNLGADLLALYEEAVAEREGDR
jgi:pimeloyl-ACP methyl ester carboxylesterase